MHHNKLSLIIGNMLGSLTISCRESSPFTLSVVSEDSTFRVMVVPDEDLHTATQAKNQEDNGFLLDIIIREGLQFLACEDQALLVGWNPVDPITITISILLHAAPVRLSRTPLCLGLNIVNRIRGLHLMGDCQSESSRKSAFCCQLRMHQ
jgi:hypothetical protein